MEGSFLTSSIVYFVQYVALTFFNSDSSNGQFNVCIQFVEQIIYVLLGKENVLLIQNNMKIKSSIEKIDDENLNIKMNRVYNKLSDHLVKKIRLASDNGKDKDALKVIKKIFNDE